MLSRNARAIDWALGAVLLFSQGCLQSGDRYRAASDGGADATPGPLVWGPAVRLDSDSAASAIAPELAADPGGNVMAVWLQGEAGSDFGQRVLASLFTAGGWQAPVALNIETPSLPVYPPKLASDGQGGFFVVWCQALAMEDDPRLGVYGRRYMFGKGWEPVATLYAGDDGGSASGALDIASDGKGSAIVVWSSHDALWSRATIRAARFGAGSAWAAGQVVSTDGVQSATPPAVAMDAAGNAMVVWGQAAGDNQAAKGAQAARLAAGSGWERPTAIEPADLAETRSSAVSRVGFDPEGQAIVVWSHSAQPGIYTNRWSAATGWQGATLIPGGSTDGVDEDVRLALDQQGNALALWNHQGGGLFVSRCAVRGSWGPAEPVDSLVADSGRVGVTRDGVAVAVWVRHSQDASAIVSRSLGPGWISQDSILSRSSAVSHPQIVMDGAGMGTVLWLQDQGLYAAGSRVGSR